MQLKNSYKPFSLDANASHDELEGLYMNYYEMLCVQVYKIVKDYNTAEDIVQEVFLEIWKKRESIELFQSFEAYLRKSCRNRALNFIRNSKIVWEDDSVLLFMQDNYTTAEDQISADELQIRIKESIDDLPEKCRIIFSLSRFEDMSYAEIADSLDISVKTVENQISKALKILRVKLYK